MSNASDGDVSDPLKCWLRVVGIYFRDTCVLRPNRVKVVRLLERQHHMIEDLLDLVDISRPQAEAVMVWHEAAAGEARAEAVSDAIVRLLTYLLDDDKTRLRALGLAYAIGRPDIAGGITLEDLALREGVANNTLANWRDKAASELARTTPSKESPRAGR